MKAANKSLASLFVDRSSPEYSIVLDPNGEFWLAPPVPSPWENRRPFCPSDNMDLERIAARLNAWGCAPP